MCPIRLVSSCPSPRSTLSSCSSSSTFSSSSSALSSPLFVLFLSRFWHCPSSARSNVTGILPRTRPLCRDLLDAAATTQRFVTANYDSCPTRARGSQAPIYPEKVAGQLLPFYPAVALGGYHRRRRIYTRGLMKLTPRNADRRVIPRNNLLCGQNSPASPSQNEGMAKRPESTKT